MWKSDLLGGQLLRNVAGGFSNEQTDIALPATKKITALLFSALWCPPCEQFLKDLIVFYDKMTVTHSDFEIILVSSDKDKRQFSKCELKISSWCFKFVSVYQYFIILSYSNVMQSSPPDFSKMPWLAVPHEADDVKCRLTKKFCVDSVPTLILLGPDGSIITKKGREKLYGDPNGLLFPWCRRSISDELGHQFYKSATNISSDDMATSSKTITTVNIKDLFANNRHVALYFSAKWCSPCRPFTQIFMKYCESLKEGLGAGSDLQVIICSMDQEETEFQDHFLNTCPDWLAIPHYEKRRVEALSERFNVENIPHVVLIAPDTSIVNFSARRRIEINPSESGFPETLYSPLIENLGTKTKSFGYDLNQKPALVLFMENATPEQQMAVIKKLEPFAISLARNKVIIM